MIHRAPFITFEGGEGSGKSTQIRLLTRRLEERGIDVLATREPDGEIRTLLLQGEPGRWDPLSEALLHFAARNEHLIRTVNPARAAGRWVLSDRFADSTMAYQGYAQGLGPDVIDQLYELVIGEDGPDLTLILDLPVEEGLHRAAGRGGVEDRYERMGRPFHERLRAAYLAIAEAEPERCVAIDADGSVEKVGERIFASIAKRLSLG